ncbi:MAG: NAD(+) synthase, partial [Phycisphaerales bacterium]
PGDRPMKLITLAGAAVNQTPMAWRSNRANLLFAIREARAAGVSLLCLPEMCTSGYGCEDAFSATDLRDRCWQMVSELLHESRGMAVCFGLPILYRNGLFNCVAMAVDGRVVGIVAKRHLAGEGLHYEPRWFKAWPDGVRSEVETPFGTLPFGDLMFDIGGVRVGFEICEDAWVAQRPGARLASYGADVILNPSASHFAFGKINVRERFVLEGSRAFGTAYLYANLLGNEAGRAIYDGGVLIASCGELLARGERLSTKDWLLTRATVDIHRQRTSQARTASFQPASGPDHLCVRTDFRWPDAGAVAPKPPTLPAWELSPRVKEEEFTRAVSLGLLDYLRKSRSKGFVVSLSGGADSGGVISLVRMMVDLALKELGPEGLAAKLSYIKPSAPTAAAWMASLLTTVYQSAEGSTEGSRAAAASLAAALGGKHHEFDVGPIAREYIARAERAIGRPLAWNTDDLTLQNIQARSRGPGAWLLANIADALLLSTSNRSEAAVGYATMDGDTCGGLSPIAGIDKAFLLSWLRWMQSEGPNGFGPLSALSVITARTPTPELRPAELGQTSEGDLMPYDVLEMIEDLAITAKQSPREVFLSVCAAAPSRPRTLVLAWVSKFFRLWSRNQWKRERYAPSFHLDDHNLDPKTWCRFPILSGGFAEELAELEAEVAKDPAQ